MTPQDPPGDMAAAFAEIGRRIDDALDSMRRQLAREMEQLRAVTRSRRDPGEDLISLSVMRGRTGVSRSQFYRWLADPALDLEGRGLVIRLPGRGRGRIRVRWGAFERWLSTRRPTACRAASAVVPTGEAAP